MTNLLKRITALFVCVLILFTAVHFPVLAVGNDEETPSYTVEQVIDLLEQIDSLQEMQDKRKTEFAATKRAITSANFATNDFDEEALAEHQALAAAYEAYIDNMFELRARAKAAYDSLDAAEQAQIPAELSGKLDPYDQLDTYFNQRAYNILVPESENSPYIYQLIGAYECPNHGCGEIPASMALINTTDESIRNENGQWVPDRLYEYGKCNYDIVYCSDAHPSPSTTNLYKRINLEDSTYYSKASARKLRAIVIHSYPYVTIDEMKAFLKANGFDSAKADKLDKSEIIAGVQMAIWYYANIGNADHNDLIDYQYTFNNYKNPWMPNRIHQFQNECWTWWDAAGNGQFSAWRPYKTFLADIGDRITSLVSFLTSLPGQDAAEDQILISDLQITRSKLVPGSDNTYTVGLKVILNHGKSADKDSVTLRAETLRDGDEPVLLASIDLSELSEYEFEVTAQDGDRIRITAEGVQYLEKGVYCYETAAGTRDDQALISVSEGMTRIHAEDTIIFNRESNIGLRISKVTRGEKHNYPISDIKFNVYAVPESAGDIGESPSSTQVNAIAVPENLVGTMTTDNTGYAFMDLEYGIYLLVEQQNDKVIAPADPICFTLPNIRKDGDIVIIADVAEYVVDNTREEFETAAVELKAYKQFDDWGKADSFRFKVAPVTSGAPMPLHDIAVATKSKPTARFEKISFDASCFDTGDPNSNVRVYKYTVTEIDDHVPGVTYDTTPYPVTVTVTRTVRIDAEQNARIIEIDAEIDYGGSDTLIITNTFTPAHAHFEVTKAFEDWGKADSFTFNLAAVTEGAPMPAATTLSVTEADPTAVFAELTFDTVGVYEYIITEVNDGIPGVTYDTTPHAVTVTVTADPDTNALSAAVDYDGADALVITNTFSPVRAHFEATKEFNDWGKADSFTFVLAAITNGAPMPEVTELTVTENAPTAVFAELEFDTVGVYEYTITEVNSHVPGVTYDTTPHTVTVTVTAAPDDTNALSAVVKYDGADALVITNTFTATQAHFEATKEFNNWGKADSFTFVLEAVTDGAPLPEVTELTVTENDPTAVFAELEFDTVGVYEYTITEVNSHVPGVTYDTTPHTVTVTVTASPDDTNALSAVVKYDGADALVITNTFTATHAHFEATKAFEDWGKADSFTFVLAAVTAGAPMPKVTELTVTRDAPNAVFAELEFDTVGVYEYTITEVNSHVPGVTYDTTPHTVTVNVTADPDTNALSAVVDYEGSAELIITNTFTPAKAHFEAAKEFNDWGKADSFTFVLEAVTDGAPLPKVTELTVTENAPTAVFAELEFDTVGVYEYTITEVNSHVPGVIYDTTPHTVTVTVTADPDTNALSAVVKYDGKDALVITNTFTATHAHFEATKAFEDWGKADSFTFVLAAITNGAPMPKVTELTVTENAPTAVFAELEFDTVGVYEYTITEVNSHVPGVTYDTTPHTVTVTVTAAPDDTNALSAVVDYEGYAELIITNTFTPAKAHFEATKEFNDWGKADSFTFVLAAVTAGAPMPKVTELTVTRDAPNAVFAELTFDTVGVYEYTITEVNSHVPGVTYDTTPHTVTVTVIADPDTNALSAVVKYDGADALVITNTFTATHAHFEATKAFEDWGKADSFTFVLEAVTDGAPLPKVTELTVTKDAPTAVFAELAFGKVGVYEYTITEVNSHVPGVTYDTTPHTVTVTVIADPDTNALSAVVKYDGADALVITNTFTATHAHFEATKAFEDWGKADSFTFVLEAVTDGAPMPKVTELTVTENAPTAVFAELTFDTVGVYEYTITEVNSHVPGVTYDTTQHIVTVTVTADPDTNALSAVVDYEGSAELIITNTFTPAKAHFEATKEFNDWGKADSFTFVLEAVTDGAPMPKVTELTVTENAPTAVFAELEFDTVGVYEYMITEVNDGVPGVTYDTTPHVVTVTVTADPDTNALSAVVKYDGADALVITNTFTATHAHFEATKSFEDWGKADSFTFVLAAVTDGAPMPKVTELTVTENAPSAIFAELEFDTVGVYKYTITEVNDGVPGVSYDTAPHYITVTVTADPDTNALSAVVDYAGSDTLIITNTFAATHAHFEATKVFEDWGKADSFTFVLAAVTNSAPMPLVTELTVTENAPTAVFAELAYETVGVFEYTITEVDSHVPGVTYDTTPHVVTVTVTADPDTNALSAVVDYDGSDALAITNTFTPIHTHFEVTKEFNDWGKADAFTFELKPVTGNAPMPEITELTVTEKAPTAVFAELEFTAVGTYKYTITEVDGKMPGITYDKSRHIVTVTVTADPDTNALSADVDYDGSGTLVITNTFTATRAHFEATKVFEDWGKADAFTFVLKAITEGAPMPEVTELTVTENAPTAVFAELVFDTVGVYEYSIKEVDDGVPGVTYDAAEHIVTVTVTADPDTNALSASVDYDGADELIITNTFTATHTHFEVTKEFNDWGKADAFTFELKPVTGNAPMPEITELTVTENAPTAVFAELTFDTVGVYKYTITEIDGGVPGVTYDKSRHIVTVTVTANPETNALSAAVDYDGSDTLVITNTFTSTHAHFEATKAFSHWGKADAFTFVLKAVTEGAPMPEITELTVTENAPTAVFAELAFGKVGVYEYTITEVDGGVPGVTYDTAAHTVTVTVTADPDTNALTATVQYDGGDALVITNTYTTTPCRVTPEVTKQIDEYVWKDGDEFIFDIAAVTENAPLPGTTFASATKANSVAVFGDIEFTEPGVYVYTITERAGNIPGVTYDTAPHTVTVSVTDVDSQLVAEVNYDGRSSLTVVNGFTPPPPSTGDDPAVMLIAIAILLAAAEAFVINARRKRLGED